MTHKRVNETEPGSSFANPIWHEGFRIFPYKNSMMPEASYTYESDGRKQFGFTSTIAGAKIKIDQLLGKAKP